MAEPKPSAPSRPPTAAPRSGVVHVTVRHTERFTVVGNHLAQHGELSLTAIGLAVHIQSLPQGARVDIRTLAARFPEGETRIAAALRELEAHGYLERTRVRLPDGRVVTRTVSYNHPTARASTPRPAPEPAPARPAAPTPLPTPTPAPVPPPPPPPLPSPEPSPLPEPRTTGNPVRERAATALLVELRRDGSPPPALRARRTTPRARRGGLAGTRRRTRRRPPHPHRRPARRAPAPARRPTRPPPHRTPAPTAPGPLTGRAPTPTPRPAAQLRRLRPRLPRPLPRSLPRLPRGRHRRPTIPGRVTATDRRPGTPRTTVRGEAAIRPFFLVA